MQGDAAGGAPANEAVFSSSVYMDLPCYGREAVVVVQSLRGSPGQPVAAVHAPCLAFRKRYFAIVPHSLGDGAKHELCCRADTRRDGQYEGDGNAYGSDY